jgi:hypothetical protein
LVSHSRSLIPQLTPLLTQSSTSTLGKEGGYLVRLTLYVRLLMPTHRLTALLQLDRYSGTHKVTYHPLDDWDFELDTAHQPIDLSLALPHYRARSQPIDHRMSMFLGSETGPIKVKVVRAHLHTRCTVSPNAHITSRSVSTRTAFQILPRNPGHVRRHSLAAIRLPWADTPLW